MQKEKAMTKPAPVTDQQKQAILDLAAQGLSQREIGQRVARSTTTVSKVVRAAGLATDTSRTANATAARVQAMIQRRLGYAERCLSRLEDIESRMSGPYQHLVTNSDGTVELVELPEPPMSEICAAVKAIDATVRELDRHLAAIAKHTDSQNTNADAVITVIARGAAQLANSLQARRELE